MIRYLIEWQVLDLEEVRPDDWQYVTCSPIHREIFVNEIKFNTRVSELHKYYQDKIDLNIYICECRRITSRDL